MEHRQAARPGTCACPARKTAQHESRRSAQADRSIQAWIIRGELPEPVTIDGAEITAAPLSVNWTANEDHKLSTENILGTNG